MRYQHFQYRYNRFSTKEKRLLGRQIRSPEVLKKAADVVVELQKETPSELNVSTVVDSVKPAERKDFLDQVRIDLNGLDPEVRRIASENLKKLIKTSTGNKLDALRGVVGEEEKGKEGEGFKEKVSGWWKEADINPENWSDKTRETVQAAGVGIAIGVGVIAVAKFARWFFLGAKKKVAAAAQKTREGYSVLKYLGLGLLVGGLGYLGFKATSSYIENSLIGALKKEAEQIRNTISSAKEMTKEQMDKLEKRYAEISNNIASRVQNPEEIIPPLIAPSQKNETPGTDVDSKPDEDAPPLDDPKKKAAKEAANQGVERGLEIAVGSYLVAFEDHPDIPWAEGDSAMRNESKIVGVLNTWMTDSSMTMERIFNTVTFGRIPDGALFHEQMKSLYTPPVSESEDPVEYARYLNCAEIVVRACVRHRSRVQALQRSQNPNEDVSVDTMSFKEYMKSLGGMNKPMMVLREQIQLHGMDPSQWDMKEIAKSLAEDPLAKLNLLAMVKGSDAFNKFSHKFKDAGVDLQKRFEDFSYVDALKLLGSSNLNMNPLSDVAQVRTQFEKIMQSPPDNMTEDELIALSLVEVVLNNLPRAEQLQPFFHEIFPDESWEDPDTGQIISIHNKKIIERYLNNRMSFSLATRLMQYKGMIEQGNVAGVALMQGEILKFIRIEEPGVYEGYLKTRAYRSADNFVEKVISGEFLASLEESFPNIDKRMQMQIVNTLYSLTPKAFETALGTILGGPLAMLEPLAAESIEHPVIASLIGAKVAHRPATLLMNFRLSRTDPSSLIGVLKARGTDTVYRKAGAALGLRIHPKIYDSGKNILDNINIKVMNVKSIDNTIGVLFEKRLRKIICGDFSSAELKTFATDVRLAKTKAIASGAEKKLITELEGLISHTETAAKVQNRSAREAIRITAHPLRGRILSHGIPFAIEALGAYMALKHDIPALYHYAAAEEEAQEDGKTELADIYQLQKQKKYIDLTRDIGGGAAYYFAQKKIARMALNRTGSLGLRGALNTARAGAKGTFVVALATEAVFAEAQHILDSLERNLQDIDFASTGARGLSQEELQNKISEYKTEWGWGGWAPNSWGQFHRYYSLSRVIRGDTEEEIKSESDTIRSGLMEGYLFNHIFEKAQSGDIFATNLLTQMFESDGTKKEGGEVKFHTYVNSVKVYLENKFGTENDIFAISQQQGLAGALREADAFASLRMDLNQYRNAVRDSAKLLEKIEKGESELALVSSRIAFSSPDEDPSELQKRSTEIESDLNEWRSSLGMMSFAVQWQTSTELANGKTIADFVYNKHGGLDSSWSAEELSPHIDAYISKKEEMIVENTDPSTVYEDYMKRAGKLHVHIRDAGTLNGQWFINQTTYQRILEYGYLLDSHPCFDIDRSVRNSIYALPGVYWTQYPTSKHPYQKKFDAVQKKISAHIAALEERKYEFMPFDRSKASVVAFRLGQKFYSMEGMFIVGADGIEKTIKGDAFSPEEEGRYYVFSKNKNGIEQPGKWYEVYKREENEVQVSSALNRYHYPYGNFVAEIIFADTSQGSVQVNMRTKEGREKLKKYFRYRNIIHRTQTGKDNKYYWSQKGVILIPRNPGEIKEIAFGSMEEESVDQRMHVSFGHSELNRMLSEESAAQAQKTIDDLELKPIGIPNTYKRDKFEGYYYLQADGSFFWDGGLTPSGKKLGPKTYVGGVWTPIKLPLNEHVSRRIITPNTAFQIPMGEYEVSMNPVDNNYTDRNGLLKADGEFSTSLSDHISGSSADGNLTITPKMKTGMIFEFKNTSTGQQIEIISFQNKDEAIQVPEYTPIKEREGYSPKPLNSQPKKLSQSDDESSIEQLAA